MLTAMSIQIITQSYLISTKVITMKLSRSRDTIHTPALAASLSFPRTNYLQNIAVDISRNH